MNNPCYRHLDTSQTTTRDCGAFWNRESNRGAPFVARARLSPLQEEVIRVHYHIDPLKMTALKVGEGSDTAGAKLPLQPRRR